MRDERAERSWEVWPRWHALARRGRPERYCLTRGLAPSTPDEGSSRFNQDLIHPLTTVCATMSAAAGSRERVEQVSGAVHRWPFDGGTNGLCAVRCGARILAWCATIAPVEGTGRNGRPRCKTNRESMSATPADPVCASPPIPSRLRLSTAPGGQGHGNWSRSCPHCCRRWVSECIGPSASATAVRTGADTPS